MRSEGGGGVVGTLTEPDTEGRVETTQTGENETKS